MNGQMTLDLFGVTRERKRVEYVMPCPIREECGAFLLEDGIDDNGKRYTRGCGGSRAWCGRVLAWMKSRKEGTC